jgi:hypothetical protein
MSHSGHSSSKAWAREPMIEVMAAEESALLAEENAIRIE